MKRRLTHRFTTIILSHQSFLSILIVEIYKIYIKYTNGKIVRNRFVLICASENLSNLCPYSEFFWSAFSHIRTEFTERYSASFRIQAECGKIRTRKTPNANAFHAVIISHIFYNSQLTHFIAIAIFPLLGTHPIYLHSQNPGKHTTSECHFLQIS